MKPELNNTTMENLKNLIRNNRILRRNGREVRKIKTGTYAIFTQTKNGMRWSRYKPDRPLETAFMARLLAGSVKRNNRYAAVKVAHWNEDAQDWVMLKLQL